MNIKFEAIIRTEHFDTATFADLIQYESHLIEITKYDYFEPLKKTVDKHNIQPILELFDYHLSIIFKGKKRFWASFSSTRQGVLFVGGGLTLAKKDVSNISELTRFLELFSRNNQLLYAYLCTEDEFDDKHKVVDKSSYGWEGVSQWDFQDFLPGVHWYTLFGKELVNSIGEDVFSNVDGVTRTEPADGAIAFHLNSQIENNESRQAELEAVEVQIGDYFYNRHKKEGTYKHPAAFKAYIESFGPGY